MKQLTQPDKRANKPRRRRNTSPPTKLWEWSLIALFAAWTVYVLFFWKSPASEPPFAASPVAPNVTIVQATSPLVVDLSGDGNAGTCACMPPVTSSHPQSPRSSPYRHSRPSAQPSPSVNLTFSPYPPPPRVPLPPTFNAYLYHRGLAKRPRFRQAMKDRAWGAYMPIMKGYWFFAGIINGNADPDEQLYGVKVSEPTNAEIVDAARCEVEAHHREVLLRRELHAEKVAFAIAERAHAQRERRAAQAIRKVASKMYVQGVWMTYLATPTKDTDLVLYRANPYRFLLDSTTFTSNWQQTVWLTLTAVACAYVNLEMGSMSSLLVDGDEDESDSDNDNGGNDDDNDGDFPPDVTAHSDSLSSDTANDDVDLSTSYLLESSSHLAEPSNPPKDDVQESAATAQDEGACATQATSAPVALSPSSECAGEDEVQVGSSSPELVVSSIELEEPSVTEDLSSPPSGSPALPAINDDVELERSVLVDPPVAAPTDSDSDVEDDVVLASGEPVASLESSALLESSSNDEYVLVSSASTPVEAAEESGSSLCDDANTDAVPVDEPVVAPPCPPLLPAPEPVEPVAVACNTAPVDVAEVDEPLVIPTPPRSLPVGDDNASPSPDAQPQGGQNAATDVGADVTTSDGHPWQKVLSNKDKRKGKQLADQVSKSVAPSSATGKARNRRGKGHGKGKGKGKQTSRDAHPLVAQVSASPPPRPFVPVRPAGDPWGLAKLKGTVKATHVDMEPVDASSDAPMPSRALSPLTWPGLGPSSGVLQSNPAPADVDMTSVEPASNLPSAAQLNDLASVVSQALAQAQIDKSPVAALASGRYNVALSARGTAPMDVDVARATPVASHQSSDVPPPADDAMEGASPAPPAVCVPVSDPAPKLDNTVEPMSICGSAPMEINQVPLRPAVSVPVSDFAPHIDSVVKPFLIRGTAPLDINQVPPNQPATAYRFSTLPVPVSQPISTGNGDVTTNGKSTGNGKKQRVNGLATSRHAPDHQPVASPSSSATKRPASPSFVEGKAADKGKGKEVDASFGPEIPSRKLKHIRRKHAQQERKRGPPKDTSTSESFTEDEPPVVEMPQTPEPVVVKERDNGKMQKLGQAPKTSDDDCRDIEVSLLRVESTSDEEL